MEDRLMEWMDIETAPKKHPGADAEEYSFGPTILLSSTSGLRALGYWGCGASGRTGWVSIHDHLVMDYWNSFTHWMPLPPPPVAK
jgi:hypothetical protein